MVQIILDTDFIINAAKHKIDIKTELERICDFSFEICILDRTLDELEGKPQAKLAKALIVNFKVIETSRDRPVDDLLVNFKGAIVATQDRELKEKLKKRNIGVITIRQSKFLRFV
ncbi:MAG: ribonuclease VapC [Candidatus Nanoarchaeia archaeon]|nr:ribonuclease VapC [Candidatus Nanoarchaeia archaeon]